MGVFGGVFNEMLLDLEFGVESYKFFLWIYKVIKFEKYIGVERDKWY